MIFRNTFVSRYWGFRFFFQCTYYLLVLMTAFLQIFDYDAHKLRGIYIAIMSLSSMFIWLELQQLLRHPMRYVMSPYNYVDWLAYLVPMVACGFQIWELDETGAGPVNDSASVTWFGFAILAVYLHIVSCFSLCGSNYFHETATLTHYVLSRILAFRTSSGGGYLQDRGNHFECDVPNQSILCHLCRMCLCLLAFVPVPLLGGRRNSDSGGDSSEE